MRTFLALGSTVLTCAYPRDLCLRLDTHSQSYSFLCLCFVNACVRLYVNAFECEDVHLGNIYFIFMISHRLMFTPIRTCTQFHTYLYHVWAHLPQQHVSICLYAFERRPNWFIRFHKYPSTIHCGSCMDFDRTRSKDALGTERPRSPRLQKEPNLSLPEMPKFGVL